MSYQREKWQAHMNRVGASALRNETAEMSQYFSQFGGVNVGSDFKTVDPECYAPGGAPGCDFGGMDKKDFYEGGRKAYRLACALGGVCECSCCASLRVSAHAGKCAGLCVLSNNRC